MNSISLTSYDLKSDDYPRLNQYLTKNGFIIVESNSETVIQDKKDDLFNYGIIFRSRKVILLDDRFIRDEEYKARSANLKDLLDGF